jgi:hypothetical protein
VNTCVGMRPPRTRASMTPADRVCAADTTWATTERKVRGSCADCASTAQATGYRLSWPENLNGIALRDGSSTASWHGSASPGLDRDAAVEGLDADGSGSSSPAAPGIAVGARTITPRGLPTASSNCLSIANHSCRGHHQRLVRTPILIALAAITRRATTMAKVLATAAMPTAGSPIHEP